MCSPGLRLGNGSIPAGLPWNNGLLVQEGSTEETLVPPQLLTAEGSWASHFLLLGSSCLTFCMDYYLSCPYFGDH